jgi:hypothetical protein
MKRTSLPPAVVLVLAALLACAGAILLIFQSGVTFWEDEWLLLTSRVGSSASTYLDPHNDHIAIVLVAIYKALLGIFGMRSALPWQIVSTVLFLLSAAMIFFYVRRCVGDWLALLAMTLILFLGAAWIDLLWPFQMTFSGSIATGLAALLLLDRDEPRRDAIACALLVISTAFSEIGVAFAVAALVNIALAPSLRRRRLYVGIVPLGFYLAWFIGWGHKAPNSLSVQNILDSPKWVFEAVSQGIASLVGLSTPLHSGPEPVGLIWGEILCVILIVLAAWRIRRVGGISRGLWTVLALGGAFWFSAAVNAITLFREPTSNRYQLPSAVFVLLIAAELLRGFRPNRIVLGAAAAVTAAAVFSGLVYLGYGRDSLKNDSLVTRARLTALDIARPRVQPFTVVALQPLITFRAGPYYTLYDRYGSPAYSESELVSRPDRERGAADDMFAMVLGTRLTPPPPGGLKVESCRLETVSSFGATPEQLPTGQYELTAQPKTTVSVRLARFGDGFSSTAGSLQDRASALLNLPADLSTHPWRLYLVGTGSVKVCSVVS